MATLSHSEELFHTTLANRWVHLRILGTHKCNRQLQFRFYLYCSTIRVQFECTNIEQNVKILFTQGYGRKLIEQCNLLHTDPVSPHIMAVTSHLHHLEGHRDFLKSQGTPAKEQPSKISGKMWNSPSSVQQKCSVLSFRGWAEQLPTAALRRGLPKILIQFCTCKSDILQQSSVYR